MRTVPRLVLTLSCLLAVATARASDGPAPSAEEAMLKKFFTEALVHGEAYENLRALVTQAPGRLSGSKSLERAVVWGGQTLGALHLDRVDKQDVMVPHWERGETFVTIDVTGAAAALPPAGLRAVALGGSEPGKVLAEVVEVKSLAEVEQLGREKLAGKIVFFNRPMDPALITGAYGVAGDQRNRGPGVAAKYGAVAALTRSLTHALDDVPHTGATNYLPGQPKIPAAALSTRAADWLSAALAQRPHLEVGFEVKARWFPDAPSHNVIGELRGAEFPDEIMLVGGHLDSWDIAPGAHDDGAGVVQSIEVLRLFRALGLKPRHTLRCVLFTNEENGLRGATAYASAAKDKKEKHIFAVETDNGGFQPRGFNLGSTQGDAHARAARWRPLFEPYGLFAFTKGTGGADVSPLLVQGCTVAGLVPDSQRYFDYHHTTEDSLDKVNPRELHLGAAALAALIWLVDTQGL